MDIQDDLQTCNETALPTWLDWWRALCILSCSQLHVFSGWTVIVSDRASWTIGSHSLGLQGVKRRMFQSVPWYSDEDRCCVPLAERKNQHILLAFLLWESWCHLEGYSSSCNWCHDRFSNTWFLLRGVSIELKTSDGTVSQHASLLTQTTTPWVGCNTLVMEM